MNIEIVDHRIKGAIDNPIPGGSPMNNRRMLLIHFTGGASGESSIEAMKQRGVSAHLVIERDGTIRQCRPFNMTCGHAGKAGDARWQDPKTGQMFGTPNSYGIGIELANAGDDPGALAWAKKQGAKTRQARHRNGGAEVEWEEYDKRQIDALFSVAKALCVRYNLDDISGHDCVAPERKNDPGPLFPMEELREFCGFGKTLPKVHRKS